MDPNVILNYLYDQKIKADDQYEARLSNQEYIPSTSISNIITYLDGEIKVQQQITFFKFDSIILHFKIQTPIGLILIIE